MFRSTLGLHLLVGLVSVAGVQAEGAFENGIACKPCDGTEGTCEINMAVNLFASELGYFEIEGCAGTNPTLHLELDRVYKFNQFDMTNWYHLVGFAYEADGAHIPVDELEPGISREGGANSSSPCIANFSCPAPMYFIDEEYQGVYSNIPELVPIPTEPSDDFGLDVVEPLFFHPLADWQEYGQFSTFLKFDQVIDQDIFYFCHIHAGMSGRIKFVNSTGDFVVPEDTPPLPYEYDVVSESDAECGTFNISDFSLPHPECADSFVCEDESAELSTFAACLEAMNCHMFASMSTEYVSQLSTFSYQMIPHHQNAVNMAKSLLKNQELSCDTIGAEEGETVPVGCELIPLLFDIINTQNAQIIDMFDALEQEQVEQYSDCVVEYPSSTSRKERDLQDDERVFTHEVPCTPCSGTTGPCNITVTVDFFAGQQGYYEMEGCTGVNPTLYLEVDRTYWFDQSDISNWYHLIGLAYEADGAHVPVDELEPGIVPPGSSSDCASTNICPAPMYYMMGSYTGEYSNNPDLFPISNTSSDDFGLDTVEPLFFHPLGDWQSYGPFETALRFTVDDFQQDFFYFCHIHAGMSGRIKLIDSDGNLLNENDTPELPYEYDVIQGHDAECGSFGLNEYQLPHPQCPELFVCGAEGIPPAEESGGSLPPDTYVSCIESTNCAMLNGMTTNFGGETFKEGGTDDIVLFLRQMIPHHHNAINMAKSTLKSGVATCSDFATEEGASVAIGCLLEPIIRSIIVSQNRQIQTMEGLLERFGVDLVSNCDILGDPNATSGASSLRFASVFLVIAGVLFMF